MRSWMRLVLSFSACYGAGFLGSIMVQDGVRAWYAMLNKPFFTPPDWVFPAAWAVLYALMAIALYLVWEKDPLSGDFRGWVPLFFAHLLLNAAWPLFFFGLHALLTAFVTILILIWCVAMLLFGARTIEPRATWLLVPYFLWLLFAATLNATIWLMN